MNRSTTGISPMTAEINPPIPSTQPPSAPKINPKSVYDFPRFAHLSDCTTAYLSVLHHNSISGKEKAPKALRKFPPLFNYMLRIVGKSRLRTVFSLEVKEEFAFCFFTNFSLSDWLNSYLFFVYLPQNPCYHKPYSHTLPHQPTCPNQPWQPCNKNPHICKEVSLPPPSPLLEFTPEP